QTIGVMVIVLAFAAMITVTTFASPIIEDRVMFAACLLLTVALVAASQVAWREPRTRAALIAIGAGVLLYHAIGFVVIYRGLVVESAARIAALRRAAPGQIVEVPPSTWPRHDNWAYGEDLQWAYMREFVAHRVFDVGGLELAPRPALAQPTPPERMHVEV